MNVKTEMVEVNDLRFLREMFDFKPFAEISQYEMLIIHLSLLFFVNLTDLLLNVIGVITGPGRVISQSKYRLIEIEISDENHNKLFCIIWESNVDLYLDQLKKSEGTIPIVIIQFCKRNLFRGEIRISTHFQASKVVINADVKEVKDFRMRIRDDSSFVQQVSVIQGGQRLGGEFDDLQVKSLEDLSCLEDAPKNSIPALIEEILVVCNLPEIVDKYTPKDMGEQIFIFDTRLSDLLFGTDLVEVSRKSYVTTDLSNVANENISELFVEGAEFNSGVDAAEGSQKVFVTPDLFLVSNEKTHGWGVEGSVKRCLDLEFDGCDHVDEVQMKKKEKIAGEY
ncbi:hypothetical protein SASPL_156663 [Salvia splendens]|uniref:Uncharacterized protein n=1 Tax=Salvia splendens TaxID=180675 RepID=A0A8X8VWB3_SALSN|nr:hypothetical protein SASPL_156663 [Salvia splendens]